MRIALFGGSGRIGSQILVEAVDRGHEMTVIVRRPDRVSDAASHVVVADATDPTAVAQAARGHDAAVSALSGFGQGDAPGTVVSAARAFIAGLPRAGVDRLLVVGGAGSLLAPDGERLIDRPQFPEAWKAGSRAQIEALAVYRDEGAPLRWTFLSPADIIEPGERTGSFSLAADDAVFNAHGESRISTEDYALALIDELEEPQHVRRRFTLGYA